MDVTAITPLILTYDEAPNIARTLDKLYWARRIIVVDSGSTDGTLAILQRYPAVDVLHRPFDDFATQWNFGVAKVETAWVLALDADYELSDALIAELRDLAPDDCVAGYEARFIYRMFGHPLRGALYPAHTVLYRKACVRYRNTGHTQRLTVEGSVRPLVGTIFHDDRKSLQRWFSSQQRYARLEADYLLSAAKLDLRGTDRIRILAWPAPFLIFAYTLLIKGCIVDGWHGWLYVLQRTLAEIMIAIEIIDRRVRSQSRRATP